MVWYNNLKVLSDWFFSVIAMKIKLDQNGLGYLVVKGFTN